MNAICKVGLKGRVTHPVAEPVVAIGGRNAAARFNAKPG